MVIFSWIAIALAGIVIMVIGSRKAVHYASSLAQGLSIPPFLIGFTLISIGTDIPEIANSVVSSLSGHGDLNVGDSVGSVMTQVTLVFGLLPFFAGKIEINRMRVLLFSASTIIGLVAGIFLFYDGWVSRVDAVILIAIWMVFSIVALKFAPMVSEPALPMPSKRKLLDLLLVLFFLSVVGIGATAFVRSAIEFSVLFGVPEYLISFFGSSLGTSMPELVVDIAALSRGKRDFAVGDVIGSCFVDSTLSIGAGPLIVPIAITAGLAIKGSLVAILVVAVATSIAAGWKNLNRWTGLLLLLLYAAVYVFFLVG